LGPTPTPTPLTKIPKIINDFIIYTFLVLNL